MKNSLRNILKSLLIVSLFAGAANLRAQGTAFTYQGLLDVSNAPANGNYNLSFQLYNAATTNGTAIDLPVTQTNIAVSNGLFTVSLNFTNINFIGTNYWVQISAATNGDTNYEALTPLLPITPAPYAISAGTASNLLGTLPASQLPAGVVTNNATNVTLAGTFSGSGAGLTSLSVSALSAGANTNAVTFSNTNNVYYGNGSNLTGVIAASVVGGFTNSASNAVSLTNVGNVFVGNGSGLSNLNSWSLTGNAGTTPGVNFLGTTDSNTLQFRANGKQAFLLDGNFDSNRPNVIGGSGSNTVAFGVYGATIAGGYKNNMVDAPYGVIGGGSWNSMTNTTNSVIAGGEWNYISDYDNDSTIGGGSSNYIGFTSLFTTIAGGYSNNIINGALGAVIGGGSRNTVEDSEYATVPGGFSNLASGNFSFAAGQQAQAFHDGAFVWADSQNASFGSTNADSFNVRAHGGVTFVTAGAPLTVGGPVVAGSFSGSGSGLTGLTASNLSGSVPLAALPAVVVTNTETNVTLSGTFSGNGNGLTNVNAATLSGNIPSGNFGGTYTSAVTFSNAGNVYYGNGGFLTNISAGAATATNVPTLTAGSGVTIVTNAGNPTNYTISATGGGGSTPGAITNLNGLSNSVTIDTTNVTGSAGGLAVSVVGQVITLTETNNTNVQASSAALTSFASLGTGAFQPSSTILSNITSAPLTNAAAFQPATTILSNITSAPLTNAAVFQPASAILSNITSAPLTNAALFQPAAAELTNLAGDNGAALTNLNATNIVGTLTNNVTGPNVALLNASQTFTGVNTFPSGIGGAPTVTAISPGIQINSVTMPNTNVPNFNVVFSVISTIASSPNVYTNLFSVTYASPAAKTIYPVYSLQGATAGATPVSAGGFTTISETSNGFTLGIYTLATLSPGPITTNLGLNFYCPR